MLYDAGFSSARAVASMLTISLASGTRPAQTSFSFTTSPGVATRR